MLALKGHKTVTTACDWATANQCCTCVTASTDGKICVSTLLMPWWDESNAKHPSHILYFWLRTLIWFLILQYFSVPCIFLPSMFPYVDEGVPKSNQTSSAIIRMLEGLDRITCLRHSCIVADPGFHIGRGKNRNLWLFQQIFYKNFARTANKIFFIILKDFWVVFLQNVHKITK